MTDQTMMWLVFGLLMVVMLAIDLGMNRKAHKVSFRQALAWSVVWVSLAMAFNAGIYVFLGKF
jgi:tellurite resistance protein TerC